ncbi:MAG: signal peptidase II [Planctomycetaceae bacterium]|nr:signal peptidase II [Planctomycetaceae bacterium]MCB9953986.1 signal peptidase II [Planctomycetaceae bacterium]
MTTTAPLSQGKRWLWLMTTTIVVVGLDQWSKVYAVAHWKNAPPQSYFGGLFQIQYAENTGAFLSLFAGLSDNARFWVLTVFNGLLLLGVTLFLFRSKEITWWTFLALALVVAGGIGNLIDRARFAYVIDYWVLQAGSWRTGVFNVADMAITGGFLMMLPLVFWGDGDKAADGTPNEPAKAEGQ